MTAGWYWRATSSVYASHFDFQSFGPPISDFEPAVKPCVRVLWKSVQRLLHKLLKSRQDFYFADFHENRRLHDFHFADFHENRRLHDFHFADFHENRRLHDFHFSDFHENMRLHDFHFADFHENRRLHDFHFADFHENWQSENLPTLDTVNAFISVLSKVLFRSGSSLFVRDLHVLLLSGVLYFIFVKIGAVTVTIYLQSQA